MANPKHGKPTRTRRNNIWATAPYNFVPLPEEVVTVDRHKIPGHNSYADPNGEETFTGHLDCTLTTESPTYTRTALNTDLFQKWADDIQRMMQEDADARREYAQFNLDDAHQPLIPGSSLRGMTRALVEIAGYGKMQWVTKDRLFFRTMDNTAIGEHYRGRMGDEIEGGFLRQRGQAFYIKKCQISHVDETVLDEKRYKLYEGRGPNKTPRWSGKPHQHQPVWVELSRNGKSVNYLQFGPPSTDTQRNLLEGRLVISGDMQGKKKEFVFLLPEQNAEEIEILDKLIERFHDDDQITRWQRNAFKKDKPRLNVRQRDGFLSRDLSKEGDPVFFLRENGELTFFGRAKMFRLPYSQSPFDLVPKYLHRDSDTDLAEAIFGYIPNEADKQGRAGRVYFSDARFEKAENDVWLPEGIITPKILSGPKPTTFQHYLVQDDGKGHNPDDKKTLAHYGTPPEETVIRGHKLYWHQGPVGGSDIQEARQDDPDKNRSGWKNDTQHTQIKPVNKGVTFRFKVHFENLRDYELGALLWALNLPDNCRHKIGMGKPLGLGSVKITPSLVLSNRKQRYQQLFDGDDWQTAEEQISDLDSFKQAFEQFVLNKMDESERNKTNSLAEVERIKMLLKLLEWQGPPKNLTQYMTIQPKPNQFQDRPVLPDPLNIERSAAGGRHQTASTSRQSGQSHRQTQATSTSPQKVTTPPKKPEYRVGAEIQAKVTGKWKKGETKVELSDGGEGILKGSRSDVEPLYGKTVTLVVDKVKNNGVPILGLP